MNIAVQLVTCDNSKDDLCEGLRDDLFEAFFGFELAIARWMTWLGEHDCYAPFGQRLQKLADHPELRTKAGPNQTKRIQALPAECSELLRIRNLAAHSRMLPGKKAGQDCVLFETVALALSGQGAVIPVETSSMVATAAEFRNLSKKLEGWLKQVQSQA